MYNTVITESHYLPSIEFFVNMVGRDILRIEHHEHFQKQTYRNRCYILGANKVQQLSIPIIKGNSKTIIKDLKIDNSQNWNNEHWRSIISAYGKAPFFEYFSSYFEPIFKKPSTFLVDFNHTLLTVCRDLLGMTFNIETTLDYEFEQPNEVLDLRSVLSPKTSYAKRSFYEPNQYIQVFGKDFVPNLSIIDLLMNEGPNALNIVTNSKINE